MGCLADTHSFTGRHPGSTILKDVSVDLIRKLKNEALTPEPLSVLSGTLFSQLRKVVNQVRHQEILGSIQGLAMEGSPEGTRLLAAFLDVNTPGARLLPQVKQFHSSRRRRFLILGQLQNAGTFEKAWLHRLDLLGSRCNRVLSEREIEAPVNNGKPGYEAPWPVLRACLRALLMDLAKDKVLCQEHRDLLLGLLKLEIDSRQERVSNLAGTVNPFNVRHVRRLLPMLSTIDGDIRDLRQLMAWIADGKDKVVFNKRLSRGLEVMDGNEFGKLLRADHGNSSISPLMHLLRSQNDQPIPLVESAVGMVHLMALSKALVNVGLCDEPLSPLMAATLIHDHYAGEEVWIPLEQGLSTDIEQILQDKSQDNTDSWWSLSGLHIVGGQLCVPLSGGDELSNLFSGALPSFVDVDKWMTEGPQRGNAETNDDLIDDEGSAEIESEEQDLDDSNTAVSQLVMQNIQSVSVLLGFLRNPKITAIPGLVAKIAERTRNPRIIETIASDRTLYSGFANRGVPLACLTSPCNVPVKTLVKFIHVKYISKVDLRRMALDKTGMRREVIGEIDKYLNSLD